MLTKNIYQQYPRHQWKQISSWLDQPKFGYISRPRIWKPGHRFHERYQPQIEWIGRCFGLWLPTQFQLWFLVCKKISSSFQDQCQGVLQLFLLYPCHLVHTVPLCLFVWISVKNNKIIYVVNSKPIQWPKYI